jgi:dihydropteroate synthase
VTQQAPLRLGPREFAPAEPVVMAIVNRTPDSFYDHGTTFSLDAAVASGVAAFDAGADLVDVGGVKFAIQHGVTQLD